MMMILWGILCILFLFLTNWLLITLLLLEIMTFFILSLFSMYISSIIMSDFLIICFFSIFVMEGVIALAGLIILVSFTGSDYLSSSSTLKC